MPQTKFLLSLALHAIQRAIGSAQKFFDGRAVCRIDGDPHADGDSGLLAISLQLLADSRGSLRGFCIRRIPEESAQIHRRRSGREYQSRGCRSQARRRGA